MTAVGAVEEMAKENTDMVVAELSDAVEAEAIHLILERGRKRQLSQKHLQGHYLQNFAHDRLAEAYTDRPHYRFKTTSYNRITQP
jgi:hypothetical protein